jgi:hypothetical protein
MISNITTDFFRGYLTTAGAGRTLAGPGRALLATLKADVEHVFHYVVTQKKSLIRFLQAAFLHLAEFDILRRHS